MNGVTDFLFARPSFLEGVARIFDFGGTLQEYNESRNGDEADHIALTNDVKAIALDMQRAIKGYEQEQGNGKA